MGAADCTGFIVIESLVRWSLYGCPVFHTIESCVVDEDSLAYTKPYSISKEYSRRM
jgi:hypothetical protein